jgi:hypothetical protein
MTSLSLPNDNALWLEQPHNCLRQDHGGAYGLGAERPAGSHPDAGDGDVAGRPVGGQPRRDARASHAAAETADLPHWKR